jgi:hypothetical protein
MTGTEGIKKEREEGSGRKMWQGRRKEIKKERGGKERQK